LDVVPKATAAETFIIHLKYLYKVITIYQLEMFMAPVLLKTELWNITKR